MKTLCMDTAHKFLVIGLFEDEKLIAKTSERAWKQQSEKFFPALMACMEQAGWCADYLDEIVITAVSYTHLDVYKRQRQIIMPLMAWATHVLQWRLQRAASR